MNIQAEKLEIIEWLAGLHDQLIIEKIKFLKRNTSLAIDWWDTISESEKASIDKGLFDIKNDKVTPHSEIRKKYEKWL